MPLFVESDWQFGHESPQKYFVVSVSHCSYLDAENEAQKWRAYTERIRLATPMLRLGYTISIFPVHP
jgi:hypothetical protein